MKRQQSELGPAAAAFLDCSGYGTFRIYVFESSVRDQGVDIVLTKGTLAEGGPVLARVTSACSLGTAFHAGDCDCAGQLDYALEAIDQAGRGIMVYLDQEGRGHGLITKVRALAYKNKGLDTLAAVEELGLPVDVTDYSDIPNYLQWLGIESVRLLTNNPNKVKSLVDIGVDVEASVPCIARTIPDNAVRHLMAKRARGHRLPLLGV